MFYRKATIAFFCDKEQEYAAVLQARMEAFDALALASFKKVECRCPRGCDWARRGLAIETMVGVVGGNRDIRKEKLERAGEWNARRGGGFDFVLSVEGAQGRRKVRPYSLVVAGAVWPPEA